MTQREIIQSVVGERNAQDRKWGEQNHTRLKWLAILMEEVGEIAKEVLEGTNTDNYRGECIQAAAVAIAMVESLDRKG